MQDPYAAAKRAAGRAAADLVPSDCVLGLGTGSTVAFVLERLAERAATGLRIHGVPTSEATAQRARALGLPLASLADVDRLHLTIDGADEIDPRGNMIKGGGGALLREKVVAAASDEMIVVVGDNKCVPHLGAFRVPIEVLAFGCRQVIAAIGRLSGQAQLRQRDGKPFVTDEGNWILDCDFGVIEDPGRLEGALDAIPGVVESGLFVGMAGRVLVGDRDGSFYVRP
ncbi:MAG: ribose-5-phosphate isomerase RpiA [Planctomycetota bacterium]